MKIKKSELRTVYVTVKTMCDLCGKDVEDGIDVYETNEVSISHRKGSQYPEGSNGNQISPDICPDCWCNIILPFLREKGLKTEYVQYGF